MLEWPAAHGPSLGQGVIRQQAEDFRVIESLTPQPVVASTGGTVAGQSEHLWLWVEKIGHNTAWVGQHLARQFDIRMRDVGWSGLKDRHAVARQWFSLWLPGGQKKALDQHLAARINAPGIRLLDHQWQRQKIRRGSHASNHFDLLIRGWSPAPRVLAERLQQIARQGVPNYFGPQRFGHQFDPTPSTLHWSSDRQERSLQISSVRSYLFNIQVADQVRACTWRQAKAGEWLMWRGSNAGFRCDILDQRLQDHLDTGELLPSAWLPGSPADPRLAPGAEELASIAPWQHWVEQLVERRVQWARRPRVLQPRQVDFAIEDQGVRLQFELPPGAFATAVLAELVEIRDHAQALAVAQHQNEQWESKQ